MSNTPDLMTHERIMTGEEYVSYSDYLLLQRERDEALMDRGNGDIATMTRNHYERILRERDEWAAMCGRYKQERDEAIDRLREWSSWCVQYMTERDEAREQAQRLRVQLNHYTQANEMAEQAFSERNKAHEIAERAIEDLAWFNETNARRLRNEIEQLKEGTK